MAPGVFMIRRIFYKLCMLLIAGTVVAATLPFDPSRGLVIVKVTIDDRVTGRFGIDTGADRLYINRSFAEENELNFTLPTPGRRVSGISGASTARPISLRSIEIGDAVLENVPAVAIDLDRLSSGSGGALDGLIGHEILRRFYVTVDYPRSRIELTTEEPRFLAGTGYRSIPFSQYGHLILVEVRFNDEIKVPMILDYCASHTLITSSLSNRLGLQPDRSGRVEVEEIEIGEKTMSSDISVIVSDLSHYRRSTPRAKYEGVLGATFLKDYKITVDYQGQRIYVQER